MKKKPETLIEMFRAIEAIGTEVITPHHVFSAFKDLRSIRIMGDQVTFGEDYLSIDAARDAIEYLATQLGGTVKWD